MAETREYFAGCSRTGSRFIGRLRLFKPKPPTCALRWRPPTRTSASTFAPSKEWRLKPGALGTLAHYTTHPLLLDHNEPAVRLFLTSRPQDPAALLAAIGQCLGALSQGWRDLPHCLFRWNRFRALEAVQQNLREGSGVLLPYYAPASIAKAVIESCQQQGVTTKHLGTQTVSWLGLRRLRVWYRLARATCLPSTSQSGRFSPPSKSEQGHSRLGKQLHC